MERNTLLAIVLSVLVWFLYLRIFPPPKEKKITKKDNAIVQKNETARPDNQVIKKKDTLQPRQKKRTETQDNYQRDSQILVFNRQIKNKDLIKGATREVSVESSIYDIKVSEAGGIITSFRYKKYKGPEGKPVELVIKNDKYPGQKTWPFDISFDETDQNFLATTTASHPALYDISTLEQKGPGGVQKVIIARTRALIQNIPVEIVKSYEFPEKKNFFIFKLKIRNRHSRLAIQNISAPMLRIGNLVGPDLDLEDPYNPIKFGFYSGEKYTELSKTGGFFSDAPPAVTKESNRKIRWFGIHSRYFLLSIIPEKPMDELWADTRPNSAFYMGAKTGRIFIEPGSEFVQKFYVYVGEKEKDNFQLVSAQINNTGYNWTGLADSLKATIDVHWTIEIVRDFLLKLLIWLNTIFGNYGAALVVFAILTKLIFWPLNQKSANSMKKMGELAPQMKLIKEQYKDNPTELNKKTMGLYKKHGVNPASGCLPILIQMPFFFALYSALSNSVELWNAPFVLWIKDLSQPDTVATLAFMGGLNLNILPLLMVVTQFFQQRLTTSSADPNQQKMMKFLPILFIFIFWKMPSGLVLYWTVQNVLAIGQQLYTNHSSDNNKSKEPLAKQAVVTPKIPPPGSAKSKKSRRR